MSKAPQYNRGFTLIELIIVLAIAAIIAVIGVPSMYSMIASNRLATQTNELVASINLARSEAIKRGQVIVLCRSNGGNTCDNSSTWDKGWLIFEDTDRSNALDNGEQIIRVNSGIPDSITVTYTGDDTIIYNASGRIAGTATSFSLSDSAGTVNAHNVTIDLSGRARTEIEQS